MEKRDIADWTTGILGALLLVAAVLLFALLPSEDPVPPTFKATYTKEEIVLNLEDEAELTASQTHRITVPIDSPYVHSFSVNASWSDDIDASDPDQFLFIVTAPTLDGSERVGETITLSNEPGSPTDPTLTTFNAEPMDVVITKTILQPPRDGIKPADHMNEDAANAQSRLREELSIYPAGDWQLEITLNQVGTCPQATTEPQRNFACMAESAGAGDNGNSITIHSITYVLYDVDVEEIVYL